MSITSMSVYKSTIDECSVVMSYDSVKDFVVELHLHWRRNIYVVMDTEVCARFSSQETIKIE